MNKSPTAVTPPSHMDLLALATSKLPRLAPAPLQSPNRYTPYPSPSPRASRNSGRWTSEEHALFLNGVELYGKCWKRIADFIPTRTIVQVRTHAQKHFQRLEKEQEVQISQPFSIDSDMGVKKEECLDLLMLSHPSSRPTADIDLIEFMSKLEDDEPQSAPNFCSLALDSPTAVGDVSCFDISAAELLLWTEISDHLRP